MLNFSLGISNLALFGFQRRFVVLPFDMKNGVFKDLFTRRLCCSFAFALVFSLANKGNCANSTNTVISVQSSTASLSPTVAYQTTATLSFSTTATATLTVQASTTPTIVAASSSSVASKKSTISPKISTVVATTTRSVTPTTSITVTATPPPSTQIWDKVIGEWLGDKISFIVLAAAVGLCLILLLALIITCCRYHKLKKKTKFPKDLIINNDSAWINSNDDLLMWERNLRATEVNAAPPALPANDKRQV